MSTFLWLFCCLLSCHNLYSSPSFQKLLSGMAATTPLSAFRITGGRTFEQAQSVEIIDQLLLPHEVRWETVCTIEEAFAAIKSMKV
jgi:hypothetical protein